MIHTKLFEVGLNIEDPIALYADDNLIEILANKYEGKCFSRCLIKKILTIENQSDAIINKDGMPDFAVLSVSFTARVVEYAENEIINGCIVVNHDNTQQIICSTDDASIMIQDTGYESVTIGQKISIRVGVARYVIGYKKISVNGYPFIQDAKVCIYKIAPIAKTELFDALLATIREEEEKCAELKKSDAKLWNVMEQMIYAYKSPQSKPSYAKEIQIGDISKISDVKYVSRDPRIGAQPVVYGYVKPPDGAEVNDVMLAPNVVLVMLHNYYEYIKTIREMTEIYGTPEMIKSHDNLWRIYKKAKIAD